MNIPVHIVVGTRPTKGIGPLVRTAAVLLTFAIAGACGDETRGAADRLEGRTFLSELVTVNDQTKSLVPGTQIRLAFPEDDRIVATAGCNTLGGSLKLTDDRLVVTDLGSTEMGCDAARHEQDEWLASLLSENPRYELDDTALTLRTADTVVALRDREVVDPDRALQKTVWSVDGIISGTSVSSLPSGASATLVFGVDGVHVAIDTCNEGDAQVKFGSKTIEVTALVMTDTACTPPATQLQAAIAAVLSGTVDYSIEASSLRLTRPTGAGLTLKAR